MKKGNILVIVLPFLAILVIGVAGYFYWSSKSKDTLFPTTTPSNELTPEVAKKILPLPGPMANWKTFKTSTFSVKLPPDYITNEVMDNKFIITTKSSSSTMVIDSSFSSDPRDYGQILLMAKKSSQSIKQGQTIGGATYFVSTNDAQGQAQTGISKTAVFKYNNSAIIVNTIQDEPNSAIQSIFDQIITTLEPLDKNPEFCPSNKNYSTDSDNPIPCICETGFTLKKVSLIDKKCSDGYGSCPISIVSCQKN